MPAVRIVAGVTQPQPCPKSDRLLSGAKLRPIRLPDTGGVLTLLNAHGDRIDREDYFKDEVVKLRRTDGRNQPLNFLTYRLGLKPN